MFPGCSSEDISRNEIVVLMFCSKVPSVEGQLMFLKSHGCFLLFFGVDFCVTKHTHKILV